MMWMFAMIGFVSLMLIGPYHRMLRKQLRLRELYQAKFSVALQRVMEGEHPSDDTLATIEYLAETFSSNKAANMLNLALVRIIKDKFKGIKRTTRRLNLPDEMNTVVHYWMMSLSFRAPLQGLAIRQYIAMLYDPKYQNMWDECLYKVVEERYKKRSILLGTAVTS